ncbi:activating signal cointegrator 1 complex subunit 2 homolog isoform X4 [Amphibalanus amphitrite]|uniref:activating signal cointegrator 1 complex subunit 2 homolog isoform X4 n=1 Tax=Amphibalanus amphitrite TaxID=1232801 RepID=UPI001C9103C4|nr:activating signal cointegrator 1 complex subunit 2 homolog isoform X4 [Amphibalanus amphitrite]
MYSVIKQKGMKQEPEEPVQVVAPRPQPRARIIRRVPCGSRPPVKRRLFAVGGASQPGRVRLTVGAVTSSSAPTASRDHPAPDREAAPSVLRTQQPPKTFQRSHRKVGYRRAQPSALWVRVGNKEVPDFKISMGHQQEVMASELCDLDTKQTVLVRSAFDNTNITNTSGYSSCSMDCSGIDWQPSYSQCYTPPGHPTQTMPQFPNAPITPEQGGDYKRPLQCAASQPPAGIVAQPCRPDGDASSLMWLLDYRLDHLLEPAQESSPQAPPPQQPPPATASRLREQARPPPPPPQPQPQQQPQQQSQQPQQQQQQQQQQLQPQPQPQSQPDPVALEETTYSGWCQRSADCGPSERKCEQDFRATQDMLRQQGYYANSTTKPPFTYTELIEQAMLEEGELTVSGIYKWITSHFGFYKSCDDRWKNSVRHNLSMNPYFRKGDKAKGGSGHLWMLANVEGRRVRRNNVAARMGRPNRKVGGRRGGRPGPHSASSVSLLSDDVEFDLCDDIPSPANDIWLSSAAENKENMPITGEYSIEYLDYVPDQTAPPTTFTLEESADRILSGTNSHVEVQFITPVRNDRIAQDAMLVDYPTLDVAMQS